MDELLNGMDEYIDDMWYMISHPKIDKIMSYIGGISTIIGIGFITMEL